jgi:hexokinase
LLTLSIQHTCLELNSIKKLSRDHSKGLGDVKALFEQVFGVAVTSLEDRIIIKKVCNLIGTRAARLSAAGIASLVTMTKKLDGCVVAIDGSVYEHYPRFAEHMRNTLEELVGIFAKNIHLEQARDGSGQGAAITAALF